ncbi:hypothetical protein E2C01_056220 [Portunus trituberculatus]|uniref:Uncharacterized protein n=1 Tax=Portunus trituberculatus TaxID=210409 RepID=A0A5B7GYC5_PORTR|nr:hypothetical protein [Portunus trituberculatus]
MKGNEAELGTIVDEGREAKGGIGIGGNGGGRKREERGIVGALRRRSQGTRMRSGGGQVEVGWQRATWRTRPGNRWTQARFSRLLKGRVAGWR